MLNSSHEDAEVLEQLLKLNERTFANSHYEAAYHALSAAMHYARDVNHSAYLDKISQVAREQSELIDTDTPQSEMSSQSTFAQQGKNLYHMLAQQAHTHIHVLELQRFKASDQNKSAWEDRL